MTVTGLRVFGPSPGSPEGVVAAPPGDIYIQSDATAGKELWEKATGTGATGWRVTGTGGSNNVATVSALESLTHVADGDTRNLLGYDAPADSGGGVVQRNAASSTTRDGGLVFTSADGGRFNRIEVGYTWLSAKEFGFGPGNTPTVNAARLQAAANACAGWRALALPNGECQINAQVSFDDILVRGQGRGTTTVRVMTDLGTNVPAFLLNSSSGGRHRMRVEDLTLSGPGAYSLGVKTANCWGMRENNACCRIEHCQILGFGAGFVVDTDQGHTAIHKCSIGGNYYGVYSQAPRGFSYGDTHIVECDVNGNNFANIACPENDQMVGLTIDKTHLGFAPYGIYQEAGSTNIGFIYGCNWSDVSWEFIGNMAIETEKWNIGGDGGQFRDVWINRPYHSWNDTYKITSRPRDYAVRMGLAQSAIHYIASSIPFQRGALGTWYIDQSYAQWWVDMSAVVFSGADGLDPVINTGHTGFFHWTPSYSFDWGTIPAGSTSVTVPVEYFGPADSAMPKITAYGNGGLSGFELYVTNVVSTASPNAGSFQVHVSGGTPTSDLPFRWALGAS